MSINVGNAPQAPYTTKTAIGEGYSIAYMVSEAKRLVNRTMSGLSIMSANPLPEFLPWVMG